MLVKTINKVIREKMEDWISSIEDKSLQKNLKDDIIVTGGCLTSLFLREEVNDFDIYIRTYSTLESVVKYYVERVKCESIKILRGSEKEELVEDIQKFYGLPLNQIDNQYATAIRNLKEDQIKIFAPDGGYKPQYKEDNEEKYRVSFLSPNAISLSDKIQVVIRFWGEPDVIHVNYDFVHATNYWTFKEGLVTTKEALTCILTKQLVYQGSLYPVTSILRVKKFVKRGWRVSAGEVFKMIYQASLLDLQDPDVLEEQLIGMDVAYFSALISALRSVEDKSKLTPSYIFEIVDRVFSQDNETEEL